MKPLKVQPSCTSSQQSIWSHQLCGGVSSAISKQFTVFRFLFASTAWRFSSLVSLLSPLPRMLALGSAMSPQGSTRVRHRVGLCSSPSTSQTKVCHLPKPQTDCRRRPSNGMGLSRMRNTGYTTDLRNWVVVLGTRIILPEHCGDASVFKSGNIENSHCRDLADSSSSRWNWRVYVYGSSRLLSPTPW